MEVATKFDIKSINQNMVKAILTNDKLSEDERSKIIADIMEEFSTNYPNLEHTATRQELSETELRLIKEIEGVKLEIKEVDANLRKEIESVKLEIKEVDANLRKDMQAMEVNLRKDMQAMDMRLTKEIESVRLEIKEVELRLSNNIKDTKSSLIKWSFLFWVSQMGALIGIGFFVLKALNM